MIKSPTSHRHSDEGSTLILALVVMLVASFFVLPLMNYIMTVNQASRMRIQGANSSEVVRGGLRSVLYDPAALYSACAPSGATLAVNLAVPPGMDLKTSCTTTANTSQWIPSDLRWAVATTMVGAEAAVPAPYVAPVAKPELNGTISAEWCTSVVTKYLPCGKAYVNPDPTNPSAWTSDVTTASQGSKIFLPYLPNRVGVPGFAGGYDVTVGPNQICKVYFPGTYTDDVVVTGTTPVYFVSGVYNFEKTLRFSGDAHVVIGAGTADGCIESDAVAVADAGFAGATSSGVGATFVFGKTGRMLIDTATPSSTPATPKGISIVFNRRLVADNDADSIMNNVAIMSVNGAPDAVDPTNSGPLVVPNLLQVPASQVFLAASTFADPAGKGYHWSTLIPAAVPTAGCAAPPVAPAATCPIIDVNLTNSTPVTVNIPGYVAVPQGGVSIVTASTATANKDVAFGGGILAAAIGVSADKPAAFQLGLLNSVVQKTFKIVSQTQHANPRVTATALIQVNQTGGYAINSWVTSYG
jgi:hypothetical protein